MGHQTVIVCPGSRGGRAALSGAGQRISRSGYNVLTFDSRAQGDSDGQIVSFGDSTNAGMCLARFAGFAKAIRRRRGGSWPLALIRVGGAY